MAPYLAVLAVRLGFLLCEDLCDDLCDDLCEDRCEALCEEWCLCAAAPVSAAMEPEPAASPNTNKAALIRDADLIIKSPKKHRRKEWALLERPERYAVSVGLFLHEDLFTYLRGHDLFTSATSGGGALACVRTCQTR